MNDVPQNLSAEASAELWELASRSCNDALRPEDLTRLESLLAEDPQARRFYGIYMLMHAELAWRFRGGGQTATAGQGVAGSPAIEERSGIGDRVSGFGVGDQELDADGFAPAAEVAGPLPSAVPFPPSPLITGHYPPTTNFVGGPVFSYMVATLIVGVMLLSAWAYKVTHIRQEVVFGPSRAGTLQESPELVFVGRVTGMTDCRWSDPSTETYIGSSVPLGRKYALSAGLMEITYNSGARVILDGPCTYKVESVAGGYLALGKLTARVESAKPQAANLQITKTPNLQIPSPSPLSLSPLHRPHSHGARH